jgi:hypothetical protein
VNLVAARQTITIVTMIRSLFVLSLIVVAASAFVAPANHAAGELSFFAAIFLDQQR